MPGAIDVAVEFTSMSKTFSMAGWRIGFAVGNERLLAALARVKSYLDYGAFTPVQVAATAALNGPDDCIREMRATYKRRRDVLVESFAKAGWTVPAPTASMFAWVPIPEKFRPLGSLEFSKLLVEKADVAVAPGIGFGEHGDDYVRIALVENEQRIRQAARNIRRFFDTADKTLHNVVPLVRAGLGRTRIAAACDVHGQAALVNERAAFQGSFVRDTSFRVGIAGLGTVGASVIRILARQDALLTQRCGRPVQVTAVSARDRAKDRGHRPLGRIAGSTIRWRSPLREVDCVVELIGGAEGAAQAVVEAALAAGKHVVTANKALLAKHGVALAQARRGEGRRARLRGAVAGGIPIIKTLREALPATRSRASTASSTAPATTSCPAWSSRA